jgi:hypothetical protein
MFGVSSLVMEPLQALRHNQARIQENARLRRWLREERDQLVKDAFAAGHDGPEIGSAAGISRQRAYQIRDDTPAEPFNPGSDLAAAGFNGV